MTFSVYQYSRLVGPTIVSTSLTTAGTVPASTQWIVKDITICNVTASAVLVSLLFAGQPILGSGSAALASVPAASTTHLTGLWILNATETISAQAGTAGALLLHVSGQTGN